MALGLPYLRRVLDTSTKQKALILEGYLLNQTPQLKYALEADPHDWVYPTYLHFAAGKRQELLFRNDSDANEPNAAWPWSTNNKIHIHRFEDHKQPIRDWAYVMWDYDRLKDCGVLDIGAEQTIGSFDQHFIPAQYEVDGDRIRHVFA
jgi:hypothetical protein